MILKAIIFNILIELAFGLQCYECGFGIEMDLVNFPRVFGTDKFSFTLSKQSANQDKWCGIKAIEVNSSLIECQGSCVLVRSTDQLSRIAGCANVNEPKIDTMFSSIKINRTEYEMIICDKEKCNQSAEIARKVINNGKIKSTSSASSASLSFILFPLATFLIFYKY